MDTPWVGWRGESGYVHACIPVQLVVYRIKGFIRRPTLKLLVLELDCNQISNCTTCFLETMNRGYGACKCLHALTYTLPLPLHTHQWHCARCRLEVMSSDPAQCRRWCSTIFLSYIARFDRNTMNSNPLCTGLPSMWQFIQFTCFQSFFPGSGSGVSLHTNCHKPIKATH